MFKHDADVMKANMLPIGRNVLKFKINASDSFFYYYISKKTD